MVSDSPVPRVPICLAAVRGPAPAHRLVRSVTRLTGPPGLRSPAAGTLPIPYGVPFG